MPQPFHIAESRFVQIVKAVLTQIERLNVWQQVQQQGVDVTQLAVTTAEGAQQSDVPEDLGFQVCQWVATQIQFFQPVQT